MPLNERDIHYFIDATTAYLNRVTGNEIAPRDPTIEFQSLVFSAFTGLMHLRGAAEGFVYFTASQPFLQHLSSSRHQRGRITDENCREAIGEITSTIANNARKRFAPDLLISEPRLFSTVPDDPIEMPPAVYVLPLFLRREHAYLVIGLASPETA